MTRVTITLEAPLAEALRAEARRDDRAVSSVARRAFARYFKNAARAADTNDATVNGTDAEAAPTAGGEATDAAAPGSPPAAISAAMGACASGAAPFASAAAAQAKKPVPHAAPALKSRCGPAAAVEKMAACRARPGKGAACGKAVPAAPAVSSSNGSGSVPVPAPAAAALPQAARRSVKQARTRRPGKGGAPC